MKIAIYGKGGIGKSTISANVSATLARQGCRILQIGCDPKHDSTRLLLGSNIPTTVLDYIKSVLPSDRRCEDILFKGYQGIACVEAGGPEPGVGCAGRGIITTFELLDDLGIKPSLFDITLYDVLGDVVCGGFAVPIRNEYADAVFIVTSGEFLSLYAANNILKGVRNFTEKGNRVAGIIFNARGGEEEEERVARFAGAVHLPIITRVPRSSIFAQAEEAGCTLIERYPDAKEVSCFQAIADTICRIKDNDPGLLHPALPLTDDELEQCVLLRRDTKPVVAFDLSGLVDTTPKCLSPSVQKKRPYFGCALGGAVFVAVQVTDAAIVMHCPRSCALMVYQKLLATEQASALQAGAQYRSEVMKRLVSTDMADEDFIFGGETKLHNAIESVIKDGYQTVIIITACPPGIIGDDVVKVADAINAKYNHTHIIPVKVDGNLVGDGLQGKLDAYTAISRLIRTDSARQDSRTVNIIGEKWGGSHTEKGISGLYSLLDSLGIAINCRYLTDTSTESIIQFNSASLNLPSSRDDSMESICRILSPLSNIPYLDHPLPTGFTETRTWLTALGEFFGAEEMVSHLVAQAEMEYTSKIEHLKPGLKGKTVLISSYPRSYDWICDIAADLGMKIIKIGLTYSPFAETYTSRYQDHLPIEENYTIDKRSEDISRLKPDLVLHTYPALSHSDRVKSITIPYNPGYGFYAALDHAENWCNLIQNAHHEGWKDDGGRFS